MKKTKILVLRFSAMGDVAMVASVLQAFQQQNPQVELVMVSRPQFSPFFDDIPKVSYLPFQTTDRHKGILGLWRLFKELNTKQIDCVADLHNNLRSRILGLFLRLAGYRVIVMHKGRKEKKELTQHKKRTPLLPTVERYAQVFRTLGFPLVLDHKLKKTNRPIPYKFDYLFKQPTLRIGIAAFAQHPYKVWNLDSWPTVFQALPASKYQFIVFGGGDKEKEIAAEWSNTFSHVTNSIGQLNLRTELDLISNLDAMISMDSSGMHMASLVGVRCLSLWGATHPSAGFLGYGQSLDDCIQVDHPNRPSSIYGNKPCDCDGVEAINLISPEMLITSIKEKLDLT